MKNIRIEGSKIVMEQDLSGDCPAYKDPGKKGVQRISEQMAQLYRDPESWNRKQLPKAVLGTDSITGSCRIEIDISELVSLCWRSAINNNRASQDGPIRVKFAGERTFTPEESKDAA